MLDLEVIKSVPIPLAVMVKPRLQTSVPLIVAAPPPLRRIDYHNNKWRFLFSDGSVFETSDPDCANHMSHTMFPLGPPRNCGE